MDTLEVVRSILSGINDVSRDEIEQLTGMIRDHYRESPNVIEIPHQNIIFVGDLHGEFNSIASVQKLITKYPTHNFLFLGDYADRGPSQIETFNLVMALTLKYPDRIQMLRGNHESDEVAQRYGFYSEVTRKFSFEVYSKYLEVFQVLPMAAFSPDNIFACHGGIPEGVSSIEEIQKCDRHDLNFPDNTLFQIVWNDPKEADFGFAANSRGYKVKSFGHTAFQEFSNNVGFKLMFRAHEVFPDGYKTFFGDKLYSVFSAAYRGASIPTVLRLGGSFAVDPIRL